ncbi:MAG: MBL fold metallo-hydrolase [Rhabdochlamydiaceae bacterium]
MLKIVENNFYFEQIPVGSYRNFAYVLGERETNEAAIFDPAWEVESLYSRIRNNEFTLKYIVNTHAHFDHIDGNVALKEKTGAQVIMHDTSRAMKDIGVKDGETLKLGNSISLRFIHTPGHSPESMCIVIDDYAILTGDTLFIGECGRVDLPGGDPSALYDSFDKIRKLDRNLMVYPGHDYGETRSSTLGEQVNLNYTMAKRSREEFIQFMSAP